MDPARALVGKVLDVVLYAPVGLVLALRDDGPRLVGEGRATIEQRVKVARWVGEMTVHYGRKRLEEQLRPPPVTTPVPTLPPITDLAAPDEPPVEVPFEGYDTLAASDVVQLLRRLPVAEVRMVREYEAANRARRTVLAKADQLLGE